MNEAVALEINAIKRLRVDAPAKIYELVRAHAVGLFAAPNVVSIPRPLVRGADAFAPFIIAA
jgi:hypothetical protein